MILIFLRSSGRLEQLTFIMRFIQKTFLLLTNKIYFCSNILQNEDGNTYLCQGSLLAAGLHVVESKLQNLICKTLFKLIENKSAFHSINENLKVGKHNTLKLLKLTEGRSIFNRKLNFNTASSASLIKF